SVTEDRPAPTAAVPPPPPAPPAEWAVPPARPRRRRVWGWVLTGVTLVVLIAIFIGFVVHLPYYTIAPGGELAVDPRIDVNGAKTYAPKGDVFLLFVRERARVNVWRYVQARIDPDIDLFRESQIAGNQSPSEVRAQATFDM